MLKRLLAASLGLLLASAAGWLLINCQVSAAPPPIQVVDGREALRELTAFLGDEEIAGVGSLRSPGNHLYLNEQITEFLFNVERRGMQYDPHAYYRRPAHMNRKTRWEEHPAGGWMVKTNSLGLREDREIPSEHPDLRIFVTGDSHTDGLCGNAESFPHILEELLETDRPEQTADVFNAGVGGYSFYNYLGAFDRYAEFDMQAYIVGVYGGNDFLGVLAPYRFFRGEQVPMLVKDPEKVPRARRISAPALSQGFFSYVNFSERPEEIDLAVEASVEITLALQEHCKNQGVRLIIVYIPPAYDTTPSLFAEEISGIREIFDLDDNEMGVTNYQADAYLATLRAAEVEVVDMRPTFKAAEEPLYWLRDHHINLAGHRLIAETLVPLFD